MLNDSRAYARANIRRRLWKAGIGCVFIAVLVPFSYHVESRLETAVHIQGSEAERVDQELTDRFPSPYVHRLIFVIEGLPEPDSSSRSQALDLISSTLRSEPHVSGVLSELDWPDNLFHGKNGGTLVVVGVDAQSVSFEMLLPQLRARAASIQAQLRTQFPKIKIQTTGEMALNYDLRRISAADVSHAEWRALPVTLILLLLAFGSFIAALLPLFIGIAAISMTMGAAALLSHYLHLSILVQNLATMLGLGLGVDYALLMVSRFREAMASGIDAGSAADLAARQAGRTLLISCSTVAIGFSALLWVPISEIRSIGVAGLLISATSVLLCILILPLIMSLLGPRINASGIGIMSRFASTAGRIASQQQRWRRWGTLVTAHPWLTLFVAGAPVLLLAFQATRIAISLPPGDLLPGGAESVEALRSLEHMGRAGIVQPLRFVLELPADTAPRSKTGWDAISRMAHFLEKDLRTAEVLSLPTLLGNDSSADNIATLPDWAQKSLLRNDAKATLIEILPASTVTENEQIRWIAELRKLDLATITGVHGATSRIGGIPAMNADYEQVVGKLLPRVIAFVVGGSLVALLVGFRSLFAAVKAVLLNLVSVGAAFGALVLVFQEGHGSWLFGVAEPTKSIFPIIPILSFAIVFGLSMDYEVFLVARVLEERRAGLTERSAVIEGMATTSKLITSAAAIMIVVFIAFTFGNFVIIKMLGFTLGVAVLIDATLVRMVIGPALLQLAGDWNWWPFGLSGSSAATDKLGR